jgi:hypothetical protein
VPPDVETWPLSHADARPGDTPAIIMAFGVRGRLKGGTIKLVADDCPEVMHTPVEDGFIAAAAVAIMRSKLQHVAGGRVGKKLPMSVPNELTE